MTSTIAWSLTARAVWHPDWLEWLLGFSEEREQGMVGVVARASCVAGYRCLHHDRATCWCTHTGKRPGQQQGLGPTVGAYVAAGHGQSEGTQVVAEARWSPRHFGGSSKQSRCQQQQVCPPGAICKCQQQYRSMTGFRTGFRHTHSCGGLAVSVHSCGHRG